MTSVFASPRTLRCQLECANEMLSAMPTTQSFPNVLGIQTHQPFVKMKPDPFCSPFRKDPDLNTDLDSEEIELEEILENISLTVESHSSSKCNNKTSSKHLSGGGLLADYSNVFPNHPDFPGISTNPFRDVKALESLPSTNPFSIFFESSHKTPSSPCSNPFLSLTTNQSTQTTNGASSLAPWLLSHQCDNDLICLQRTLTHLRVCGWYYENVSWQDSVVLLRNSEPGTFLIRDSLDPNFLFSLSVQTARGPTSVRLHFVDGKFRLDAEPKLIPSMPAFETVIDLIDYYVEYTKDRNMRKSKSKGQVWIDSLGQVYSHILLSKPLYRKDFFPSLKHLARLEFNKSLRRKYLEKSQDKINKIHPYVPMIEIIKSLLLPQPLLDYLLLYPFSH